MDAAIDLSRRLGHSTNGTDRRITSSVVLESDFNVVVLRSPRRLRWHDAHARQVALADQDFKDGCRKA